MKKSLLLSILVFLIFGFNFNYAKAENFEQSSEFKLTEREAAKIAYCDYIKQNGEVMIPELGLRVVNVVEENDHFVVTLAIYEKVTNKVVNDCATYTINVRSGRILSVKKINDSTSDICAEQLASEILSENYTNADSIAAKINTCGSSNERQALLNTLKNAREAAMAKVMKGEGRAESISKYFDSLIY